ncbi:TetR/AcrR family transcriptional regulator [Cytobacillus spongiae]|uniref:TetR/AcrR family transcriptional regulator n=1 Tax=Cytobacillus spongiae TaxID=2901381 RepID=UPI001F324FC0|nr:TetR/AcrR family transcriptional regulator [Cytobacillus spongiae]UII57633.1 TetR/AcrR family transcriptional regulator [Cytobacillus spongiae]
MSEKHTLHDLKEKEREARRELILSAAARLFSQTHISKVGMRDIAKEAGISPALIYRHFEDRDELFVEVFFRQIEQMITAFEEAITESKVTSIEEVGHTFVTYLLDHDDFFQMMTYFMLDAVMNAKTIDSFNENIRKLLTLFDKSFAQHGMSEDVRIHSHAFFSALNGIVITFRNYPGRTEEEIRKHITHLTQLMSSKFTN